MQRRNFLTSSLGALVAAALAACGGAHDGSANLEPDPQLAPVRGVVDVDPAPAGAPPPAPGN